MSPFLTKLWRRKTDRPPAPAAAREVHLTVWNNGVPIADRVTVATITTDEPRVLEVLKYVDHGVPRLCCILPENVPYSWGSTLVLKADGFADLITRITLKPDVDVSMVRKPITLARHGMVRADGPVWLDDDGPFFPLGATLFWAVRGWIKERERIQANIQWYANRGVDYLRIFGDVGDTSSNWEVNPLWAEYQSALGDVIDYAYTAGMRVELTCTGGSPRDVITQTLPRISEVIRGREAKILSLEVANEHYAVATVPSIAILQEAGRRLRQAFPYTLVAVSSPQPGIVDTVGQYIGTYGSLLTVHLDRQYADGGYRAIRQPWDWRGHDFPIAHNEPIGPRSSVQAEADPSRLAMLRAVGILNGIGAFVFHNAAGITGQPHTAGNGEYRPANVWEVEEADACLKMIRNVDSYLPFDVARGRHWNNPRPDAWQGAPLAAGSIWPNQPTGVNRHYMSESGDGWTSVLLGINGSVVIAPRQRSELTLYDLELGNVGSLTLNASEPTLRQSPSLDNGGREPGRRGNLIIRGRFL